MPPGRMAAVTTEISAKSNMRAGIDRAQSEMKAFRRAVAAENAALKADTDRMMAKGGLSGVAGGKGGAAAIGNVSMQASDVAVQLQGGAKAATVIAQQGSQIAAAFGPTGAVIGGVIAIGAGIYTWATNAKETEERIKQIEQNAENARRALEKVDAGMEADKKTKRINSGQTDALEEAHRARMKEIDAAEKLVRFDDAAGNAKIAQARAAAEAAYQSERAVEAAKAQEKVYEQIDEATQRTVKAQKEVDEMGLTNSQKLLNLSKELEELSAKRGKGNAAEQAKTEAEFAEKNLALAKLIGEEKDRIIEEDKRAQDEREKKLKEEERLHEEAHKNAQKRAKELADLEEDLEKKKKRLAEVQTEQREKKIKTDVDKAAMSAEDRRQQRHEELRESRREARAKRVVLARERNRLRNEVNNRKKSAAQANKEMADFGKDLKNATNPNAEMEKLLGDIKASIKTLEDKVSVA